MTAPGGGPASSRPWVWAKELPAERHARLAAVGLMIVGGGMLAAALTISGPAGLRGALFPLSFLTLVVGAVAGFLRISGAVAPHEWARLRWMDYRECPACRETLDGLADEGACPKCGQGYDPVWLKNVWTTRYPVPAFVDVQKALEERGFVEGMGPKRTGALPFLEGHHRLLLGILASVVVVASFILVPRTANTLGGEFVRILMGWATGMLIGSFIGSFFRDLRPAARSVAFGFRSCPTCKFDLRGLPDAGVCPECRSRYTLKHLRAAWMIKIPRRVSLDKLRDAYFKRHPEEASAPLGPPPPAESPP